MIVFKEIFTAEWIARVFDIPLYMAEDITKKRTSFSPYCFCKELEHRNAVKKVMDRLREAMGEGEKLI